MRATSTRISVPKIGFPMYPQRIVRLTLLEHGIEQGKVPGPGQYEKKGYFSPQMTQNAFSFGTSREKMKKLHIQQIEKIALDKLPAPGSYNIPSPIG